MSDSDSQVSSAAADDRQRDRDAASERVRLRQLARLGELFAGFAHEIRNPLSTIGLNLQLVKEDLAAADLGDEGTRVGRRLGVVESEVARLQKILEQFLGYVRLPDLQLRAMDVNALLQEVADFVGPEMRSRGVSLRFQGAGGLAPIRADTDQLRAVLVNLLKNALDACAEGDEVMVRTQPGPARADGAAQVVLMVADTGAGMPADVREHAFQPYFSTKQTGTGLGLPTARRVVEQHGGEISLDSEPGRGTQFTILLPVDGPGATECAAGADPDAADPDGPDPDGPDPNGPDPNWAAEEHT